MKLKSLVFALLFSAFLQADLNDPDLQVATEGDLLATVCECVNLLSGDFV